MAAKEFVCILCIGMGGPEIRSDKCDLAREIIEGPHRQEFLLKRSDSAGAKRTRKVLKDVNEECRRERGGTPGK